MIRIELVNRRLSKLMKRIGIVISGAAVVFGMVFVANRLLSSDAAAPAGSLPTPPAPIERPEAEASERRTRRSTGIVDDDTRRKPSRAIAEAPQLSRRRTFAAGAGERRPKRRRMALSGSRRRPREVVAAPAPDSSDLVGSLACQQTLQFYQRMPPGVRVESLTGSVTGEYTLEGVDVAATGIPQAQESLRAYSQLDSMPVAATVGGRFTLRGRLAELDYYQLTPLAPAAADELLARLPSVAGRSGVREVVVKGPIAKPVDENMTRRRQKLWGRGSYSQIAAFVDSLGRLGRRLAVGEMVLIPVSGKGKRHSALLYAAVDVLVVE